MAGKKGGILESVNSAGFRLASGAPQSHRRTTGFSATGCAKTTYRYPEIHRGGERCCRDCRWSVSTQPRTAISRCDRARENPGYREARQSGRPAACGSSDEHPIVLFVSRRNGALDVHAPYLRRRFNAPLTGCSAGRMYRYIELRTLSGPLIERSALAGPPTVSGSQQSARRP